MKNQQLVTIKGVNSGLLFLLHDEAPFEDVIEDLRYKLEHSHQHFLSGPDINIYVKLGRRVWSDIEEQAIREVLTIKSNLHLQSIANDQGHKALPAASENLQLMTGIVRSGQELEVDGDLIFIGDVNAGGIIRCTGNILIMGALRGIAHAGCRGHLDRIIVASQFQPLQLRIGNLISRPPEQGNRGQYSSEFAYADEGVIQVDRMVYLTQFLENHSSLHIANIIQKFIGG